MPLLRTIDRSDNIGGRDLPTTNGDRDRRRRLTRDGISRMSWFGGKLPSLSATLLRQPNGAVTTGRIFSGMHDDRKAGGGKQAAVFLGIEAAMIEKVAL